MHRNQGLLFSRLNLSQKNLLVVASRSRWCRTDLRIGDAILDASHARVHQDAYRRDAVNPSASGQASLRERVCVHVHDTKKYRE